MRSLVEKAVSYVTVSGNNDSMVSFRIRCRMLDLDTFPVEDIWMESEPCDIIVPLLDSKNCLEVPAEIHNCALSVWKEFYVKSLNFLANYTTEMEQREITRVVAHDFFRIIENLGRVIELCENPPVELKDRIISLLYTVLANPELNPNRCGKHRDVGYTVLSALRSYKVTEDVFSLINTLIENPFYAAAAFNMLLKTDQSNDVLIEKLYNLAIKNGRADIVYLALQFKDARGEEPVIQTFKRIYCNSSETWLRLKDALIKENRDWSLGWVSLTEEFKECTECVYISIPKDRYPCSSCLASGTFIKKENK